MVISAKLRKSATPEPNHLRMGQDLRRVETGVRNLDAILNGGIPLYSMNVVSGPPGTGKSILCQQVAFHNASPQAKVLYLSTLSEPLDKLIHYQQQFSYFDKAKLDQSLIYGDIAETILEQGPVKTIEALLARVREIPRIKIVVIDSFKALCDSAKTAAERRALSYKLAVQLAAAQCTTFLVGEYGDRDIEDEPIFAVADAIFQLSNQQVGMDHLRYLNVRKMRGGNYFTGLHAFAIGSDGITVYPRTKTPPTQPKYDIVNQRVETGVKGLDDMLQGGFPKGSATLVAGGAGTGKTLLGLHFICKGVAEGEPGVIVTFQETPSQLCAVVRGFGWDLEAMEEQGMCRLLYASPVELNVDELTTHLQKAVEEIGAQRIMIDSIVDLETATPNKVRYKDYIYSLVNSFKSRGITSLLTNEIVELFGSPKLTSYGVSFIADNVVLLRYVEMDSAITRAIAVLKQRGSDHDKSLKEFRITSSGIEILEKFEGTSGIMQGTPLPAGERLAQVFAKLR